MAAEAVAPSARRTPSIGCGVGLLHAAQPAGRAREGGGKERGDDGEGDAAVESRDPPVRDDEDEQRPDGRGADVPGGSRKRQRAAARDPPQGSRGDHRGEPGRETEIGLDRLRTRRGAEHVGKQVARLGSGLARQRPEEHGAEADEHGAGAGRGHGRIAIGEPGEHQRHGAGERRPRGADKPGCRDEHRQDGEAEEHPARRPVGICLFVGSAAMRIRNEEKAGERGLHQEMRHHRQHVGSAGGGKHPGPQQRADRGRQREPLPEAQPREPVGGEDHEGEIEHDRPEPRLGRADEERARERGEEPERRERRSVQGRGQHRRDGDRAEEHERARRPDHAVEGVGRVYRRERGRGPGSGQHPGYVGRGDRGERRGGLAPAHPFAGRNERKREEGAGGDARARAEQPLLDRIAHEEQAAEAERDAADPHGPPCAEPLLEAGLGGRRDR